LLSLLFDKPETKKNSYGISKIFDLFTIIFLN
jgi:hypothetical protein